MTPARIRESLPVYGELAVPFPTTFGRTGRQGVVVEFDAPSGRWIGNFEPGIAGLTDVRRHPDGHRLLVFATGDAWIVEPGFRAGHVFMSAIDACWLVGGDLVMSKQGLAFVRLGPNGLVWHTKRLSWDGFDNVQIEAPRLAALAWSPLDDRWHACSVDLETGASTGGSYSEPDTENWERLASASD